MWIQPKGSISYRQRAVKSSLEPYLQTGIPPPRVTCLPSLPKPDSRKPLFFHTPTDLEVLMLGQLARQVHSLVGTPLWYHYDTADFLYLGIIWWAHAIQVSCNLKKMGLRVKTILSTRPDLRLSALCFLSFKNKGSF